MAILPTSYPFFRGYNLAEQLCGKAKESSRSNQGVGYLDYAILHGEQALTLEKIREQEYHGFNGNLHFGPYCVSAKADKLKNLVGLLNGTMELKYLQKNNSTKSYDNKEKLFPKSQIKKMRDIIGKTTSDIDLFLQQLIRNEYTMPYKNAQLAPYTKHLWFNGETPYLDMIELMDFIYEEQEAKR